MSTTASPERAGPHRARTDKAPRRRRDLVLACSGLELAGGGRTLLARLLASACASYADREGLRFSILSLTRHDAAYTPPAPTWYAAESRLAFASRVAGVQVLSQLARGGGRGSDGAGRTRPAFLFDLLGLGRIQSFLPKRIRSPFLLTLLGIEVWRPLRRSERTALAKASIRLAISEITRRRSEPNLPAEARACEVLHLALEERPPAGEADGKLLHDAGEGFLLIVGRMTASEAYKGHDRLLDAMTLVGACEDADPAPHLVVVGAREAADSSPHLVVAGDGDDSERLQRRAVELGLGDRVTFTGHVSEATLVELYRRCSMFVMPSRGEGFGLVYLEAMRAGKPCIAARGTAAEEIVLDGVTGLLVGADRSDELARAIAKLLGDPETRSRLGAAGAERYRRQFAYARFEEGLHRRLDRLTLL
ncbi:MAG TPA: glycosyltransferase family 4 protein [Thermoanaerobaculia bacterium]|nr:glycosyltransferase family 4 protein [Thermoanaerobaculia bacterium]